MATNVVARTLRRRRWIMVSVAAVACMALLHVGGHTENARAWAAAPSDEDKTFEWLGWAPAPDSHLFKVLREKFPGAIPSSAVVPPARKVLFPFGVVPGPTLYGESVCSDEINNEKDVLTQKMISHWGNVFPLGGIGGPPFVGKSGFAAFSGHVAQDGHIFILFGPHVGISPSGEIGKYLRKGQKNESAACGAVVAAYKMCLEDREQEPLGKSRTSYLPGSDDMEESWLVKKLKPHLDEVQASKDPMVTLVSKAYEEIEKEMFKIISTKFGSGNLVLLGGIQINMPYPYQDHFLPKHFSIRSEGKPIKNLLPILYKH